MCTRPWRPSRSAPPTRPRRACHAGGRAGRRGCRERRLCGRRRLAARGALLRGELPRPRPDGTRPAGAAGDQGDIRLQRQWSGEWPTYIQTKWSTWLNAAAPPRSGRRRQLPIRSTPTPSAEHEWATIPNINVVDGWGMSHEVPNLGILGGSTFPSSAGRNPTETIQATAWRTADHVVQVTGVRSRRLGAPSGHGEKASGSR